MYDEIKRNIGNDCIFFCLKKTDKRKIYITLITFFLVHYIILIFLKKKNNLNFDSVRVKNNITAVMYQNNKD